MPDSGAIAFIAGQISELFLSSKQDKEKYGDYLAWALFPQGNMFERVSAIAERAYSILRFKNFISFPSCVRVPCLPDACLEKPSVLQLDT